MYISLDVRYANNKSRVVLQNEELYARIRMPERLYKRRLLQVLENRDTLTVDSIVYVSLQKYIVIPQRRIDSIYQGKVENLLASPLFCDKQTMVLEKVTNEEERYIIDILFRHDYFMTVDDESGYPFIDYTAK
ncbi:MAG: hypothetical protein LBM06_01605 [Prevotellaceae bacterium]|jgi:hypothetical protein|nr:hypothetical protein [Prevotellaceae bacterium]